MGGLLSVLSLARILESCFESDTLGVGVGSTLGLGTSTFTLVSSYSSTGSASSTLSIIYSLAAMHTSLCS